MSKESKTAVVNEFGTEIYPRKIWIVKGRNALAAIQKCFTERGEFICKRHKMWPV